MWIALLQGHQQEDGSSFEKGGGDTSAAWSFLFVVLLVALVLWVVSAARSSK